MRFLLVAILLVSVSFAGCAQLLGDEPCGEASKASMGVSKTSSPPLQANDGYEWSLTVDGVCSEEHATANFRGYIVPAGVTPPCQQVWEFRGAVYTKIGFQPYVMQVHQSGTSEELIYEGTASVGLKQAFPEGTGEFTITVRAIYPVSDFDTDVDCILKQIVLNMNADYKLP